jgi:Mitochondrial small ribosomal subunit Rsm22
MIHARDDCRENAEERITTADWRRLRVLRDRFLTDAREEYWTPRDLELYDATFAQRIGWKWAGVLASLTQAGWRPTSPRLLDWGCGTGIAGRVVAEWCGIREGAVFDQSPLAASFAAKKLHDTGVAARRLRQHEPVAPGTLLILSHVVGELTDGELAKLAAFAATAEELIWVEPGSRDISRRLGSVREVLLAAGHSFAAPCTHDLPCPVFARENERHWCHFFAKPPPEIFQSAFWREFSERVEVDLRSLPYSFLASSRLLPAEHPSGAERMIGHARELKAHCQLLCCGTSGLNERTLQKRDEPDLYRRITKRGLDGLFTWKFDPERPGRVVGGCCLDDVTASDA